MRRKLRKLSLLIGVILLVGCSPALAGERTLHLISVRYPAVEFYAEALSSEAPAGVKVQRELMTDDSFIDKARINFSAGSGAYDITFVNETYAVDFASKGWLIPLDKYIQKYEDEFHFSDIPQALWDSVTYQGKIYAIPVVTNTLFFFYRDDLFKQAGLQPPKTLEEYTEVAAKLTTPQRYGTTIALKRVEWQRRRFHSFLYASGGRWFDKEVKPAFNGPAGVIALNYIKRLMKYAPPGVLSYGNDEDTVAMQQDKAAMVLQWVTRAAAMDDPELSRVVNLVNWTVPPSLRKGGVPASSLAIDGYAIPASTKNDPDVIFRTIARATDQETMKRGAKLHFPSRSSVSGDPELVAKYRHWPAVLNTIQAGATPSPGIPEFEEITMMLTKRVAQALAGELGIKEALDLAAQESYELLKERGYYK